VESGAWLDLCAATLLPSSGASAAARTGDAAGPRLLQLRLTTETAFDGGSCVAVLVAAPRPSPGLLDSSRPQQQQEAPQQQREEGQQVEAEGEGEGGAEDAAPGALQSARLFDLQLPLPRGAGALAVECVACWPAAPGGAAPALALVLRAAPGGGGAPRACAALALLPPPRDDGGGAGAAPGGPDAAAAEALVAALSPATVRPGAPAPPRVVRASAPPGAAGGGWQRWRWLVPPECLDGAAAIRGVDVAAAAAGGRAGWERAAAAAAAGAPPGAAALLGGRAAPGGTRAPRRQPIPGWARRSLPAPTWEVPPPFPSRPPAARLPVADRHPPPPVAHPAGELRIESLGSGSGGGGGGA
jgi:hypothetical protein